MQCSDQEYGFVVQGWMAESGPGVASSVEVVLVLAVWWSVAGMVEAVGGVPSARHDKVSNLSMRS